MDNIQATRGNSKINKSEWKCRLCGGNYYRRNFVEEMICFKSRGIGHKIGDRLKGTGTRRSDIRNNRDNKPLLLTVSEGSSSRGGKGGFIGNQRKSLGKVYAIKLEKNTLPETPESGR